MDAKEFYEKLTAYTAVYVAAVDELKHLRSIEPRKPKLPLRITSSEMLEEHWNARDQFQVEWNTWDVAHHAILRDVNSAEKNLRDLIPLAFRATDIIVKVNGNDYSVSKNYDDGIIVKKAEE